MGSSVGKRQREQQKVDRAQAKAARRSARQAGDISEATGSTQLSESELIDDLRMLQQAVEDGGMTMDDFEERRLRIQAQFERLSR